ALEIIKEKGWCKVWLECDSELVIKALENYFVVPWCLRRRWMNCFFLFLKIYLYFFVHIYRE
ncbi:hypothetical protein glysoja_037610, partial [Glycine soja]